MKRAIPVIIAILLILIVGGAYGGKLYYDKYSYSNEEADLNEYFGITASDDIAVILQEERMDFKAKMIDGYPYFDIVTVHDYFNERFYEDKTEGLIIYVEPLQITTTVIGESGFDVDGEYSSTAYIPARYVGDTLYLACDYVQKFTNYTYDYYDLPARMQVYTAWEARDVAHIKKDTQIRYRGGVKSEILKQVKEGDEVQILETLDDWSCVKTDDGFIGYVENKRLDDYSNIDPIPATVYIEPEFTSISFDGKVNLAWHNVAGTAGNDTFYSLISNTHDINVISPTWFGLADNDGGLTDFGSTSYIESAHGMGMQVWALISNFVTPEVDTYEVLSKTSTRRVLIDNIMAMVEKYGLDGINVDFEDLSVETGEPFIQFIRELSVRTRKAGVILSVDNYVPLGNTDFYNRAEQGVYADYVIIMGYDEHYRGSAEAGSVASIGYVQTGIEKTVAEVPANKVINAVPFYTRLWETTGVDVDSQAVGMEIANQYVKDHNISLEWDQETCQNYGEYTSGDTIHQVWMEDAESIKVKLNVMDTYNLAGVASWCLGFETPDIWDVIAEYIHS